MKIYSSYVKRSLDFFIALIGIIITSPIMMIVAILVKTKLGSPIVFSQKRPGKNEKTINIHKFRSMTDAKDSNGYLLPDDQRMTKFGKFLRSTSLDELPQLFSILKGDMSLIGPRPQSYENVLFMTKEQRKRHTVTPGLTGLAQINGRNAITWDKKLEYDLKYIDNITFLGDLKIFFHTITYVLKREDITSEGNVTTETVGQFLLRTNQITQKEYDEKILNYRNHYI